MAKWYQLFFVLDHSFKVFACWDIVYCPYRLRWRCVGLFYFFNKTLYSSYFVADFLWRLSSGQSGVWIYSYT